MVSQKSKENKANNNLKPQNRRMSLLEMYLSYNGKPRALQIWWPRDHHKGRTVAGIKRVWSKHVRWALCWPQSQAVRLQESALNPDDSEFFQFAGHWAADLDFSAGFQIALNSDYNCVLTLTSRNRKILTWVFILQTLRIYRLDFSKGLGVDRGAVWVVLYYIVVFKWDLEN